MDWVGFSGFNWAGQYKGNVWVNPSELFDPTIKVLKQFHKPLIIAETASAETRIPSDKASWIQVLPGYIKENPQIKGVVWFNTTDNGINWSIDSTPVSSLAYKEAFDDYFVQKYLAKN